MEISRFLLSLCAGEQSILCFNKCVVEVSLFQGHTELLIDRQILAQSRSILAEREISPQVDVQGFWWTNLEHPMILSVYIPTGVYNTKDAMI